jgi:hypothetical protein
MKNSYSVQALAVNTVNTVNQDSDLGEALREAEVTLNALELIGEERLILGQKALRIAESVLTDPDFLDRNPIVIREEFRKLLKK